MPDQAVTATVSEVSEFLELHRACSKARPWAGRCATLAEAWDSCTVPDWLIWARKQAGFEQEGRAGAPRLGMLVRPPGTGLDDRAPEPAGARGCGAFH